MQLCWHYNRFVDQSSRLLAWSCKSCLFVGLDWHYTANTAFFTSNCFSVIDLSTPSQTGECWSKSSVKEKWNIYAGKAMLITMLNGLNCQMKTSFFVWKLMNNDNFLWLYSLTDLCILKPCSKNSQFEVLFFFQSQHYKTFKINFLHYNSQTIRNMRVLPPTINFLVLS